MTYRQWDVAIVPFPFVDAPRSKPRPVVLISRDEFALESGYHIACMVTSTSHATQPGDTIITDIKGAGLKKKSMIRLKLFTLDERLISEAIGQLSESDQATFKRNFAQNVC